MTITIKKFKLKDKYIIKHYPESNPYARMLNKKSGNMVFTEEGARKVKQSLMRRFGK